MNVMFFAHKVMNQCHEFETFSSFEKKSFRVQQTTQVHCIVLNTW